MLRILKQWVFWYKRSRALKKFMKTELLLAKMRPPHEPPTPEQIEAFKKEWDLGWDSHMISRVESRRTYYEAYLRT